VYNVFPMKAAIKVANIVVNKIYRKSFYFFSSKDSIKNWFQDINLKLSVKYSMSFRHSWYFSNVNFGVGSYKLVAITIFYGCFMIV